MKSNANCYDELRAYVDALPVIDCHDHAGVLEKPVDVLSHLGDAYFDSDIMSATSDADLKVIMDKNLSLEKRWPVFERAWRRTRFTGYGKATALAMERFFGEKEVTLASLKRMQKKIPDFSDPRVYYGIYDEARIVARIADTHPSLIEVMKGTFKGLKGQRVAVSLPSLHFLKSRADITGVEEALGRTATSLDEYAAACREIFAAHKKIGAVTFKDQSAYMRSLAYSNPARAEAEAIFNRMIADPRYCAEYNPYSNPLSDYLMHEFMRAARDLDLPVQIHTGHMAGIRNDVARTNAAGLRSLVEMHRDVRFDLFHGNWPYSGDLLFLVKNYPNVAMDMCWVHIIDPLYSRDLLMQAVSCVPHGKIHGFGSDVGGGTPDIAWAHCMMARDNIATALAELVDIDYIGVDDAKEIAADWLFNNPNEFFRLGLKMGDCTTSTAKRSR